MRNTASGQVVAYWLTCLFFASNLIFGKLRSSMSHPIALTTWLLTLQASVLGEVFRGMNDQPPATKALLGSLTLFAMMDTARAACVYDGYYFRVEDTSGSLDWSGPYSGRRAAERAMQGLMMRAEIRSSTFPEWFSRCTPDGRHCCPDKPIEPVEVELSDLVFKEPNGPGIFYVNDKNQYCRFKDMAQYRRLSGQNVGNLPVVDHKSERLSFDRYCVYKGIFREAGGGPKIYYHNGEGEYCHFKNMDDYKRLTSEPKFRDLPEIDPKKEGWSNQGYCKGGP